MFCFDPRKLPGSCEHRSHCGTSNVAKESELSYEFLWCLMPCLTPCLTTWDLILILTMLLMEQIDQGKQRSTKATGIPIRNLFTDICSIYLLPAKISKYDRSNRSLSNLKQIQTDLKLQMRHWKLRQGRNSEELRGTGRTPSLLSWDGMRRLEADPMDQENHTTPDTQWHIMTYLTWCRCQDMPSISRYTASGARAQPWNQGPGQKQCPFPPFATHFATSHCSRNIAIYCILSPPNHMQKNQRTQPPCISLEFGSDVILMWLLASSRHLA